MMRLLRRVLPQARLEERSDGECTYSADITVAPHAQAPSLPRLPRFPRTSPGWACSTSAAWTAFARSSPRRPRYERVVAVDNEQYRLWVASRWGAGLSEHLNGCGPLSAGA